MKLFIDILTSLAVCAFIIVFIRAVKSVIIMPVKKCKGIEMFTVLRVEGSVPQLEQTLKSLAFVKDDGKMPVIIVDGGMDENTRKIAELSARSKSEIQIWNQDQFDDMMADMK